MTDFIPKITHKEWRKAAKKARRQKIRQKLAEARKIKEKERENSPSYQFELEKKRLYEEYEEEKEEKEREERNLKWLLEEERAQKQWREDQRLKKLAWEEKQKEIEKIKQEWEKEQQKFKEQKKKIEAQKKAEEKRRQELLERINDFICNGGDTPIELQVVTESNPDREPCSFYQKVGACRFGSQCSRNHQYYQISNILMFVNFYTHFKLDQSKSSEYDTDISLEFEDTEMYLHFKEFYNDIVPEFKKFGEVTMVKVCCNTEPHLRGNVYVEYKNEREALVAYKTFQGRWYGGKQLNIEFIKIRDWGSAVCGDFIRHRCPKGNSCNFLHVFRNPKNEFSIEWSKNKTETVKDNFNEEERHKRNWRWSESPERDSRRSSSYSSKNSYNNGRRKTSNKKKKSESPERRSSKSRSNEKTNSNHQKKRRSCSSERHSPKRKK